MAWLAILGASLCGVAGAVASKQGAQTDKGFELHVTNSDGPVARICFDAANLTDKAPAARGSYYLAGPAKFDGLPEGQWKYRAIFDGVGMVNLFEIRPEDFPTQVCYTSKWMNTGFYNDYAKDHREPPRGVLFEDTSPSRKECMIDMCDYMSPNDNNWVKMIVIGGEAVWFSDTTLMVTMDPKTLNCTGLKTWSDDKVAMGHNQPDWLYGEHMVGGGSAHPLLRPGTSTVVEFLSEAPLVVGKHYVDVYTFDASARGAQNRTRIAQIENDQNQYFHSFGVTPNYVVLPFNLMSVNLGPMHPPFILGSFAPHWKGVHVVDYMGGAQLFDDMDPFFHVHIANTFENASGITMDLVSYSSIPFERLAVMDISKILNKTARDTSYPRGQIRRLHMNLQTKKTTVEKLTDNNKDYDFVKINDAKAGKPYCIYYAVEWYHDDTAYGSMAIMKHDICHGKKSFWSQPDTYLNEPFFIASSPNGAEDHGTLIFTANDGQKGKAIFVALDAQTFTEIERIELPSHIPFTAHGQFIPAPAVSAESSLVV